jgi:galactokinase
MSTPNDPLNLSHRFESLFGARPRLYRGPGRINIIGEHVDYCGGLVMPAAIDRACCVTCAPNHAGVLRVQSDFGVAEIGLDRFERQGDWRDYVAGMAFALMEAGHAVVGHDILISSDVPIGAGVSSSAALEVAIGLALTGGQLRGEALALVAQRAENHYVGMACGIMDQFASANGVAGHALLLNCQSLSFETLAVPEDACFLLVDSGVKHAHIGGGYESRRADCEAAAKSLGVAQLCEIDTLGALSPLSGNPLKRARHVVTEIARTEEAAHALQRGDLPALGQLMTASHTSLSADMEVSTPQVDHLAALLQGQDGVYGARMMGGGFGGSVIALVDAAQAEHVRAAIVSAYGKVLGRPPEAFVARLSAGAHEIEANDA